MKKRLLFVALIATSASAFAAQTGGYVGVALGQGHSQDASGNVGDAQNTLAAFGVSSSISGDESRSAYSIFGGYRFNPNIAGEVGYVNFGTYHMGGTFSGPGGSGSLAEDDKVSALYVAAVPSYPINDQFSVFGKFGLANTKNDETCSVTGTTCPSASDTGINPIYGIGASVKVAPNISVGLEYDIFSSVGNNSNEYTAGDFSFFHLNATYNF